MKILKKLALGGLFLAAAGISGCASSSATPAGTRSSMQSQSMSPAGKMPPDIRKAQTETSLEALQRGESAVTPRGSVLKEIFFEFDSYNLSNEARTILADAADWLRDNPAARVEIEGHCDERGTVEYNLALGAKRAYAAKDYLVSLGIAANRLSTISYGEEIPVCRESNEECWQKNRRDRFVALIGKPGI